MFALPIDDPIRVQNRLQELGMTKYQLLEVVDAAVAARRSCTVFDPLSARGWKSWCDGNRRLREVFVPLGWLSDEKDGIPSVIHPELKVKVTMCNTDAGTGLKHHLPQPTSKKGAATEQVVSTNQISFLDKLDSTMTIVPFSHLNSVGRVTTWYLCVHCEDEVVRAELSCPVYCEDGYFKDFAERIFLNPDGDNDDGVKVLNQEPDGGDSGFEISVTRKQAL